MQIIQVERSLILLTIFLSVLSSQMAHIVSGNHFQSKKLAISSQNNINKQMRKNNKPRCLDKNSFLGSSLCNSTNNYPNKKIAKKMGNKKILNEFKRLFGVAASPYEESQVQFRFNFEDTNMCRTRKTKYYPKVALNSRGKRRYVVQAKNNYTQEVSIVKCLNEGHKCGNYQHTLFNEKTFCKQERITIRLLALDDNGNFILDYFPIEGGCACFLAKNVNF